MEPAEEPVPRSSGARSPVRESGDPIEGGPRNGAWWGTTFVKRGRLGSMRDDTSRVVDGVRSSLLPYKLYGTMLGAWEGLSYVRG